MNKESSQYIEYLDSLPKSDQELLNQYFEKLSHRISMAKKQKNQMVEDFENGFLYYSRIEVDIGEAVQRLDTAKLGDFYATPPILWFPLDDAAKIYPLSMQKNQMSVFRLSAYMKEDVVPELLQLALTFAIKRFPSFATTVKKGFFWHYMDSTKRRFQVEPEVDIPCRPLNVSGSHAPSFRILYYKKRIGIEYFHILTDGNGGLIFLKTIVAEYLRLLGYSIPCTDGVLDIDEIPSDRETSNDFLKAEYSEKASGFFTKLAPQMSGHLAAIRPCQILHFELESDKLKAAAGHRGGTISAYVLALMFVAQKHATKRTTGNFQIQLPVNMRSFYDSETLRNFALFCNVQYPIEKIADVESMIPDIKNQLREKVTKKSMNEMMNATVKLVQALRYIPLIIKRPVALLAFGFLGERVFTSTLTNLGIISLPKEMSDHIQKFDVLLGAAVVNRAACSMVSYKNTTLLTVIKNTPDSSFETKLYSLLKEHGLNPKLEGSEFYGY